MMTERSNRAKALLILLAIAVTHLMKKLNNSGRRGKNVIPHILNKNISVALWKRSNLYIVRKKCS